MTTPKRTPRAVESANRFYADRPYPKLYIYNWRIFGRWQTSETRREWATYLYKNERARRDYDVRTTAQANTAAVKARAFRQVDV